MVPIFLQQQAGAFGNNIGKEPQKSLPVHSSLWEPFILVGAFIYGAH